MSDYILSALCAYVLIGGCVQAWGVETLCMKYPRSDRRFPLVFHPICIFGWPGIIIHFLTEKTVIARDDGRTDL